MSSREFSEALAEIHTAIAGPVMDRIFGRQLTLDELRTVAIDVTILESLSALLRTEKFQENPHQRKRAFGEIRRRSRVVTALANNSGT